MSIAVELFEPILVPFVTIPDVLCRCFKAMLLVLTEPWQKFIEMFLIKADYFYCKSTKNKGMNFNTRGGVNTIPREPLSPLNLTPTNQPLQGIKVQSPSQMKQPLQNTIDKSQNNLPICHAVIPKFSKKARWKVVEFSQFSGFGQKFCWEQEKYRHWSVKWPKQRMDGKNWKRLMINAILH